MVNSMTGFASAVGQDGDHSWVWELRSVNGKGCDIRLRLPEGAEGLEQFAKKEIAKSVARGTIYATLRVQSKASMGSTQLNEAALSSTVQAALAAQKVATDAGLEVRAISAAELIAVKGVMEAQTEEDQSAPWMDAVQKQLPSLISDFVTARGEEGQHLNDLLSKQTDELEKHLNDASVLSEQRKDDVAKKLKDRVAALISENTELDTGRLEQELALLAVKSDVTEELDRLGAHIAAARDLLKAKSAIGRKFDFLMQEFNREANTLCSKSGSSELTRTGLEMKTLIDQMREQVQNIE